MSEAFDRDWQLAELLDETQLAHCGSALAALLGGDLAICDRAGHVLWGVLAPTARRAPLVIELEPVGWLCAAAPALPQAANLLTQLLRTQLRFKMASSLHVQAMSEDFQTLRLEHARLLDSQARYKALAEQLEQRVKAQVAQLEERQQMLYEAEKLASVGQLAAGVAHEVNNPLGFVRSNLATFGHYLASVAELKGRLADGAAAWAELDLDFIVEDGQALLQESLKGLDRIARIVAELKDFSNVDRASEEYADLNDCLRHAAGVIDGQLPPGVSLRLELLPLPPLVCLPGHLNQMFMNLLKNAAQAIADAGRPGTIHVASEADEQGITVRIHDDGVGMNETQLARAFEPFYTTRPVGSGAGLGLSSARNIVLAHSGRIELSSAPNAGTTVSVFFPVAS